MSGGSRTRRPRCGQAGLREATSNVYGNGHTSLFADMMEAIEQNRKPYVDAVAGRNALEMVLAIYKSQKAGAPVKLPLQDFASTDMQGNLFPERHKDIWVAQDTL